MSVTEDEKVRARHHCGYINAQESSTFVMGIPAGIQTQFQIEGGFNRILPAAEAKFRDLLAKCDAAEAQIAENQDTLVASKVGDITLRPDEFKQIVLRYKYWVNGLCNLMGIQANPYDQRFTSWLGGGSGINVRVHH